ncbi:MAG TPA: PHP-associated domain-containing protein [bacterium]|nr:PHP-associated domain-containing protein [bacterium]
MRNFRADFHIHTVLSPCGDLAQSPRKIIEAARKRGLALIGVADHNATENARPTMRLGEKAGVAVFPAMEVTSAEEVHVLALFGNLADAGEMQGKVYQRLQEGENDPERFGYQVIVDEHDNILGMNKRLLLGATDMDLETVVDYIRRYGGLAVASHVDRPAFSCTSQLGFVPPGLFDAVELSPFGKIEEYAECGYPVIRSSDAHRPQEVGSAFTVFELEAPTLAEVKMALAGEGGRRIAGYG